MAGLNASGRFISPRPRPRPRTRDYLGSLQACARELGTDRLSISIYERWRDGGRDHPSSGSIILRHGSWYQALTEAGLRMGSAVSPYCQARSQVGAVHHGGHD